jgi:hypothetical protein
MQHRLEKKARELLVTLDGALDERFEAGELLREIQASLGKVATVVSFDLRGIPSMNSCGVREWLLFMKGMIPISPFRFALVTELFLDQAGLVPAILGPRGTNIQQCELPYRCEACTARHLVEVNTTSLKDSAPKAACPSCKAPMKFDSDEGEYFGFLRYASAKAKGKPKKA